MSIGRIWDRQSTSVIKISGLEEIADAIRDYGSKMSGCHESCFSAKKDMETIHSFVSLLVSVRCPAAGDAAALKAIANDAVSLFVGVQEAVSKRAMEAEAIMQKNVHR